MTTGTWVLLLNAASTLCLTGLIWIVQLVHYPSFAYVAPDRFEAFTTFHQRSISYIVMPLMLVEVGTALALLVHKPTVLPMWIAVLGAALLGVIWASTFALQVPLHTQLTQGHDENAIRKLVQTNWIRTIAWTSRAALAVASVAMVMGQRSPAP